MKSKIAVILLLLATQAQAERTITFADTEQGYFDCQALTRDLADKTAYDRGRMLNHKSYNKINHPEAQWAHFDCLGYIMNRVQPGNKTMTAHLLTDSEMEQAQSEQQKKHQQSLRDREAQAQARLKKYGL